MMAALTVLPAAVVAQDEDEDRTGQSLVGRVPEQQRRIKKIEDDALDGPGGDAWLKAKRAIERDNGIWFSVISSVTTQWGVPNGGYGAVQAMFTPKLDWQIFEHTALGSGSFQFAYLNAQYKSGATGASLAGALELASPINDQPVDVSQFQQVTYTHEFPGNWMAVTLGQYTFSNFDTNPYSDDQQLDFIASALSGNITQTFSQGSLGAFLHVYPTRELRFAAGFQDANNPAGNFLQFNTFGQGPYAWFLYGSYSPKLPGLGRGEYSLVYYNVPSAPAQPFASDGFALNAAQPVGKRLALFVRANAAPSLDFAIRSSISGGAVYHDPLGRDPLDKVGLAIAWNRTNPAVDPDAFVLPSETMFDFYWSWTVFRRLLVTPDVQFYLQPALATSQHAAAIFSLRVTKPF